MELTTFRTERDRIIKNIAPHKAVRLDEIRHIGDDVFEVGNLELSFAHKAQVQLAKAIGTNSKQLHAVKGLSGEVGQVNFSNYLTVAQNKEQEQQVVLVANRHYKQVSNLFVPKKEFIPADTFFDFAEIFANDAGFDVDHIETAYSDDLSIAIYMRNHNPEFMRFAPDEDFRINDTFLKWDGTKIELGCYYERLICTNGATQTVRHRDATIFTLGNADVSRILKLGKDKQVLAFGFDKFKKKALLAMETPASLCELSLIHKHLTGHVQLPEPVVEEITHLSDYTAEFESRNINTAKMGNIIKTGENWWKLYNKMTALATHSPLIEANDLRRNVILNYATQVLECDHDIVNYIE